MTLTITPASFSSFGDLLRYLRRRVQLTQRDLGIATGYSEAHVSRLESNQRLPDPIALMALFVPALDLGRQDEVWVARLLELANRSRAEPSEAPPNGAASSETTEILDSLEAIPPSVPHEVSRPRALAHLRTRLLAERHVALSGLAGTGKTTLAATLARDYSRNVPAFWLTLTVGVTASVDTLIRQLALFLRHWGQPQVTPLLRQTTDTKPMLSLSQQVALLGTALTQLSDSQKAPLLCLDNVDLVQVNETVVQVLRHLMGATPAMLLLTGREETPLLGVAQIRLAGLERAEGLAFIHEMIGPSYTQEPSTKSLPVNLIPTQAERLLEKTGGNPMLLRLALGQLLDQHEPLDPTTFITYLETQPQVSSYLLETVQQRLTPAAWHLLSLISIFRQPVNLYDNLLIELDQAATGPYEVAATIAELQRRHLIDRPTGAELHPLVRDYVYAALVADPPRRKRLHLLAAEWLEQALGRPVEAAYHYNQAGQLETMAALLTDQAEVIINRGRRSAALAVVDEALSQTYRKRGDTTSLLRQLLTIRGDLLVGTLQAAEAEANYREALALPAPPAVRAHIIWRLAQSLAQRGQADQAVQLCRETAASIAPTDLLLLARLASVECHALYTLSNLEEARQVGIRALTLADQLERLTPRLADTIRARIHHTLSSAHYYRRSYKAALDHSHQLVAAARRVGLRELEYAGLNSLGVLMLEYVGQTELSLFYLEQAEAGFAEIGHSYGLANTLDFKSMACYLLNEPEQALRLLDRAEKIVRQIGDLEGLIIYQADRGFTLLACGRVAEARTLAEHLLNDYPGHEACWHTMYTMCLLGMIQMVQGEAQAALNTLNQALTLPAAATDPAIKGDLYSYLALARLIIGDLTGAQQTLEAAPLGDVGIWAELNRQLVLGILALTLGDTAGATAIVDAATERAAAAGYRLYSLSAARLASAIEQLLPLADLPRLLWVFEPTKS